MYQVIKTYGHERGFSCAFRQWRADSHCSFIHGYALAIEITFESESLNKNNWVIDFGDLNALEQQLRETFDHTLIVSRDDPDLTRFEELAKFGVASIVVLPSVGAEKFAETVHTMVENFLAYTYKKNTNNVKVVSVKVSEHGANSALYKS